MQGSIQQSNNQAGGLIGPPVCVSGGAHMGGQRVNARIGLGQPLD